MRCVRALLVILGILRACLLPASAGAAKPEPGMRYGWPLPIE